MSRAIADAPTMSPLASRKGDTEMETFRLRPSFGDPHRFMMLDAFPARNFPQNFWDFVGTVAGREKRYVLSDRLFWRVTIDALGSLVPTGDGAVEVLADDGILGRIDNRGEPRAVFSQLLGRSPMQLFICSPQFFRDSLAIADVADRTQDDRTLLRDDRTETNSTGNSNPSRRLP